MRSTSHNNNHRTISSSLQRMPSNSRSFTRGLAGSRCNSSRVVQPPTTVATNARRSSALRASATGVRPTQNRRESVKIRACDLVTQRPGSLDLLYEIGNLMGEGGFGEVYSCNDRETGAERAVKMIPKNEVDEYENDQVRHEFHVLKHLDSPNLLKVYEMFEDETSFYIVSDLYKGGDLFDEIEQGGPLDEENVAMIMNTLLTCVNYCHKNNLVHRDLKPENILLEEDNCGWDDLKVIDFGLAANGDNSEGRFTEVIGSSYYFPPQVLMGSYTSKCDIWSVGVICYILMSGYPPFSGACEDDILKAILKGDFTFKDTQFGHISQSAKDFISSLLAYQEEDRPTAEEALQHPWLQEIRRESFVSEKQRRSTKKCLAELKHYHVQPSKLKQAASAIIACSLLTKEEKHLIDERFRSLDCGCHGYLDRDDLKQDFLTVDPHTTDEDIDNIFQQVNISGSGKITYSEFAIAMMMEENMVEERKLKAAFKAFDKGGKGFITAHDIQEMLGLGDDMDEYIHTRLIQEVDHHEDDTITLEDFKHMFIEKEVEVPVGGRKQNPLSLSLTSLGGRKQNPLSLSLTRTPRRGSVGPLDLDEGTDLPAQNPLSLSLSNLGVRKQNPLSLSLTRTPRRGSVGPLDLDEGTDLPALNEGTDLPALNETECGFSDHGKWCDHHADDSSTKESTGADDGSSSLFGVVEGDKVSSKKESKVKDDGTSLFSVLVSMMTPA